MARTWSWPHPSVFLEVNIAWVYVFFVFTAPTVTAICLLSADRAMGVRKGTGSFGRMRKEVQNLQWRNTHNKTKTTKSKIKTSTKICAVDGAPNSKHQEKEVPTSEQLYGSRPFSRRQLVLSYLPNDHFVRYVTDLYCFYKSCRWCHFCGTYIQCRSPRHLPTTCNTKRN